MTARNAKALRPVHGDTMHAGRRVYNWSTSASGGYWSHWSTEESAADAEALARQMAASGYGLTYRGAATYVGTGIVDGGAVDYYRCAWETFTAPVGSCTDEA